MHSEEIMELIKLRFENDFNKAYKSIKTKKKERLLELISPIYRRFYYSSIVDDSTLTPAYFCERTYSQDANSLLGFVPSGLVSPKSSEISFKTINYTVDKHPIKSDLQIFVSHCEPDFQLDDFDNLLHEHVKTIIHKLSIEDEKYIEYLFHICIHLNLIVKIPSIHSNMAQITDKCDTFFKCSEKQVLKKVIDATAALTAIYIKEIVDTSAKIDKKHIIGLLKKEITIEEVLKSIYSTLGAEAFDLSAFDGEDVFDNLFMSIITNSFLMSVILDKAFFSPFGYYLKIIEPRYALNFDMKAELLFAIDTLEAREPASLDMFGPCVSYSLTPLATSLYNIKNNEPIKPIPHEAVLEILQKKSSYSKETLDVIEEFKMEQIEMSDGADTIVQLKISSQDDKNFWKKIEFRVDQTPHDLYMEICYEFGYEPTFDYSVYTVLNESPFVELCSPVKKKGKNFANESTFESLEFDVGHQFLVVINDSPFPYLFEKNISQKSSKYIAEVVKYAPRNSNNYYPHKKATSKIMKEIENDFFI